MPKFAPHRDLFSIITRLNSVANFIFWTIFILSLLPFLFEQLPISDIYTDVVNILNIIGISAFFLIEIIIEYVLLPQANSKRRDDFIDNSFDSKFSTKNSIGYYDNDEVGKGLYKASVNLFENCFFTLSLSKLVTVSKIIVPAVMLLLMIALAYYGFKDVPFTLSILQALFSANIFGLLIKHLILVTNLTSIQNSWISLFKNADFKEKTMEYQADIYRYWLQYETLHSKIDAGISENVFTKNNQTLTKDWEEIKLKYNIT